MKLLVLITTYQKNIARIETIQNTWAKKLTEQNIPYYFVSGDKINFNAPLLQLNFKESYEQLPQKTYHLLKDTLNYEYSHIIKTDDDTFLNIDLITKDILQFDYIGKFNMPSSAPTLHYYKCNDEFKIPKKPTKHKYAEGGMYILSKKAVTKILEIPESFFINTPENYRGEDVLIGEILSSDNFTKLDIKDVGLSNKLNMDITKNGLSLHPVHNIIMSKIFNASFDEQIEILLENRILNDYNRRDLKLKSYVK